MPKETTPGTYILVIALDHDARITIGRLGKYDLREGYYLYVGSALNGLSNRLARHLRREKRLHWHIDYLLQVASVCEVWYSAGPQRRECAWAEALERSGDVEPSVAGFGSSDCRCRSHLFYSGERPRVGSVFSLDQVDSVNRMDAVN
jgi:Uri superfamily endonuclease